MSSLPPVAPAPGGMLWLVRHAQPLVTPGVCYGQLDVPADANATQAAAQALAKQLPLGAQLQVSPLQRCELLAQYLRALRPDLAYKKEARLAEMHFGQWEGCAWHQIPKSALDAWTADFWLHRFGGQECVAEFMARVACAWQEAQAQCRSGDVPVWLTHAGVIRAVSLLARGVQEVHDSAQWPMDAPAFGQCWQSHAPEGVSVT